MRLLVLGGTAWLSGQIATEAVERGHDVTCLARGESGSTPAGVTHVRADRDQPDAYADVSGADWDAIVDVSRQPGHVRRAVEALRHRSSFFAFVSSGNAYADHSTPGADESAAIRPPLDGDVMEDMETYGEAKVACELAALAAFGAEHTAVVRAGLIGGPGDMSGRYGLLAVALRSADDGRRSVLVPDVPEATAQVIDVTRSRRLDRRSARARPGGIFNATGTDRLH